MSSFRHTLGAYRTRTRKAVRFSSVTDLITTAGSPDSASDSVDSLEEEDGPGSSRGASTSTIAAAGVRNRPSSPPLRKNDAQLPDLTGQLQRESKFPSANGGLADVWTGVWNKGSMRVKVGGLVQ